MFKGEKNLKDPQRDTIKDTSSMPAPYQAAGFGSGSYTKTNKLITALYMVTDIIDKDEPLRNKLRTLGVEILSDISMPKQGFGISDKIDQVLSFLEIASTINIISEMNYSILKKEFLELNQSIKESTGCIKNTNKQVNLVEFFREKNISRFDYTPPNPVFKGQSIRHGSTRIGVQKGSTLMQALSGVEHPTVHNFDVLKKQRRNDIINIIKTINGNATIKDIRDRAQTSQGKAVSFTSFSEKTLQRELISMVKDNVLDKNGSKRWTHYSIKNQA